MGYARKKATTEELRQLIKDGRKKFVRMDEGAVLYSMGVNSFRELARDAKAIYHIKKSVLVNTELINDYLELFKDEI